MAPYQLRKVGNYRDVHKPMLSIRHFTGTERISEHTDKRSDCQHHFDHNVLKHAHLAAEHERPVATYQQKANWRRSAKTLRQRETRDALWQLPRSATTKR
jgi:hypothetical protein